MTFYTSSRGLTRNPQIASLLKTNKVRLLSLVMHKTLSEQDVLLGWGYKPTAKKAREFALKNGREYWALEDGFISWLHHPSQAKPYQRLSYIIDRQGVYYDASKPSGLDVCLHESESVDHARVGRLLGQLKRLQVSKYNQVRSCVSAQHKGLLSSEFLLLVDQTYGDASIEYSLGSQDSFERMLSWAVEYLGQHEDLKCLVKTHPDVILGKKKGYLIELLEQMHIPQHIKQRFHLLSEDYSPAEIINNASKVATVSSQLGFEALWQGKAVICFAWPFYAGRGLTEDKCKTPLPYQRPASSLFELISGALIHYPTYLHPDNQAQCEVEEIIDYLEAHFSTRDLTCNALHVPNVSLWKRSFIPEFLSNSCQSISFSKNSRADKTLIWGMKQPLERNCWRMEDGFIRSVGLGADLRRPSSLVLDDQGIYYNGKQASRLENMLNQVQLNDYERHRAQQLIEKLKQSQVTKYNVESQQSVLSIKQRAGSKQIVLITGQFQQDLSMEFGALDIQDNMSLIKRVRSDYPNAFLIYKEHPDVYSGVRPGRLNPSEVKQYTDMYVSDTSLISLFEISDRVCTICSLSGFEALIRGIAVTTYGLPFYAGWGLTDDHYEFTRRERTLELEALIYVTLVRYSRYVSWRTREITTVESTIDQVICDREQNMDIKTTWVARQCRKIGYLSQALLKTQGVNRSRS